jgi:anaerobic sulfite reductase subunit C
MPDVSATLEVLAMKWSPQAEEAVSRVPFFVRRRVRKRVEEEASRLNAAEVTLEHVTACQKRFLKNMESEVKGYRLETCFGGNGCPNRAVIDDGLVKQVDDLLAARNLRELLLSRVEGPLKMHHEFRVSIADCPNACSRPQIADLGIIAAVSPQLSGEVCTRCEQCVTACSEGAISLQAGADAPTIDLSHCVSCGLCVRSCPVGALVPDAAGYRIMLGGKLGRRPQLAKELKGIYSKSDLLRLVDACLDHFTTENRKGERFGEILNRTGMGFLPSHPVRER